MSDVRAKHYRALCREAAKQLGCKPTDERALHYGLLKLAREGFANRIIDGHDVDCGALMRLDESLARYAPAIAPMKVEVEIIDNVLHCPHCGYDGPGVGPLPQPAPATIDLKPFNDA